MKGETCASSIVEDLLDEFRRGTGLHRKVNLGARLKMDFQYILLGYDYAYFILFYHFLYKYLKTIAVKVAFLQYEKIFAACTNKTSP